MFVVTSSNFGLTTRFNMVSEDSANRLYNDLLNHGFMVALPEAVNSYVAADANELARREDILNFLYSRS